MGGIIGTPAGNKNLKGGFVRVDGVNKKLKEIIGGVNGSNKTLWKDSPFPWVLQLPNGHVGEAMDIDKNGNVIVLTKSNHIYKISPSGVIYQSFLSPYTGASLIRVDNSDNIHLLRGYNFSKINSAGGQVYDNFTGNPVYDLDIDANGNVYIGTNIHGEKYNIAATRLWQKQTANGAAPSSIAVDSAGNSSYVNSYVGFVYAYNTSGTKIWEQNLGSVFANGIRAINLGRDNRLYIRGNADGKVATLSLDGVSSTSGSGVASVYSQDIEANGFSEFFIMDGINIKKYTNKAALLLTKPVDTKKVKSVKIDASNNVFTCGDDGTVCGWGVL